MRKCCAENVLEDKYTTSSKSTLICLLHSNASDVCLKLDFSYCVNMFVDTTSIKGFTSKHYHHVNGRRKSNVIVLPCD